MKRKIAAIFAADIAGYSRLVSEDEEETLRRLSSYRAVIDDFISKAPGRIFNTAGDAVLAEFASAVDAVRCAIDIQESLRTRNRAYPPSRQMNFRIGITIGDVVERDGDLLGDGVNIAARLESLAEPGGICVSHSVYEQVLNKLSVGFADIGQQQVKNIPRPVHAYVVTTHALGDQVVTPRVNKSGKKNTAIAAIVALIVVGALGVATYTYLTPTRGPNPDKVVTPSSAPPAATQATTLAVPEQPASPATQPTSTAVSTQEPLPTSPALKLSDPAKLDCSARTAGARMFATEPPRGQGALGFKEKAYVNDGQCPVGYIKEITGGSRRRDVPRGVRCVQC
jgi:adenylate cyclase